jgi:cell division septation protein DedD
MVTFSLHRTGVVLLALGALLLGGLLYLAGCLVGQRRAAAAPGVPQALPARLPKAPAVHPPAVKAPGIPGAPAMAGAPAAPTLPGAPGATGAAAVAAAPRTFALRAGAFTNEAAAKALVQDLAGRGLKASVVAVPTSSGAVLHTVLAGSYASRRAAAVAAAELARRQGLSAAVVERTPR